MRVIRNYFRCYLFQDMRLLDMVITRDKGELRFENVYVSYGYIYPKDSISEDLFRIMQLWGYFKGYSETNLSHINWLTS